LQDLKRLRSLLENDDNLLSSIPDPQDEGTSARPSEELGAAATERRLLLCGLVLAASDLAFLALPRSLHMPWAELCREESEVGLHAAPWMRGMAELLAIPLYETLRAVEGTQISHHSSLNRPASLAAPLRHLRENARHWKANPLLPKRNPKIEHPVRRDPADGESHDFTSTQQGMEAEKSALRSAAVPETDEMGATLPGQVLDEESSTIKGDAEVAAVATLVSSAGAATELTDSQEFLPGVGHIAVNRSQASSEEWV